MIVAGTTSYPRRLDPEPFRAIADEVGALFMFDAAHLAGLIVGGAHPDPVPFADVVTFTTHKTLRGPRGGCILSKEAYAKAIDKAVFPGWQGGPLEHVIAGKAVAFREAAASVVQGVRPPDRASTPPALAEALAGEGFRLVSGGTDNHLMVVDLRPFDAELTGKVAQTALDAAGITLNKNTIPDDPRSPFVTSGLRIGTPSVTTQGMREPEMATIAELIARALRERDDAGALAAVRAEVADALRQVPRLPRRRVTGRRTGRARAWRVARALGRLLYLIGVVACRGDVRGHDAGRAPGSPGASAGSYAAERPHGAHAADPGDRRPGDVRRVPRRLRRGPAAGHASTRSSPATPSRGASCSPP